MNINHTKLRALAEGPTVGDWRYGPGDGDDENPIVFVDLPTSSGVGISILFESDWATDTDAAFVAEASPQVVLSLLAENEKMRSFLAEVSRTSGDKWAVMAARNLLKEFGHD
ncbi:ead/Ea22-like family protein [Pseudomonas capeferrum]|uniref:ead/Ea22-like family protein n=1 Tax=Pseudomonas capeferrum TaxID=1495066 RepID=UPI0004D4D707|nr:ead/Ea22-like family protein [Pseudomonas capeferrum]KEY87808.1 hypothetical protein PC358_01465 [Pseudomonas capeferrum]MCH7300082.1 ead/Ea22-like family protein [Pseudomonas capeferrum]